MSATIFNSDELKSYQLKIDKMSAPSVFAKLHTILQWVVGPENFSTLGKIGYPDATVFFTRKAIDPNRAMRDAEQSEYKIKFQKYENSDAASVTRRGATPSSTGFNEDNRGVAKVCWTDVFAPVKVGKHAVEEASNPSDVYDDALMDSMADLVKEINSQVTSGTLTEAQQNVETWANLIGVTQALSDGTDTVGGAARTHYFGVDRTVHSHFAATVKTATVLQAASILTDNKPTLDMYRGMRTQYAIGDRMTGPCLHVVHPTLWYILSKEADGISSILRGEDDPPKIAVSGFKQPVIQYGNDYIVYDRLVDTDTSLSFYLDCWFFQISRKANFALGEWQDDSVREGGSMYLHTKRRAKCRFGTDAPHLNFKVTGLSVSGS